MAESDKIQRMMIKADEQDARRLRQIEQQSARMANMRQIIQTLAVEIYELEKDKICKEASDEEVHTVRTPQQIIDDAIKAQK